MPFKQRFVMLFIAVISLSTDALIVPTHPVDSESDVYQSWKNGTGHEISDVLDIAVRSDPLSLRAPAPISIPITAFQMSGKDAGYIMSLKVGSKSQAMPVLVDTGSSTLWFLSDAAPKLQRGTRAGFQTSGSKTFQALPKNWQITYRDGSKAAGTAAKDTVQVGSRVLTATIGVAKTVEGILRRPQFSGVAGFTNGKLSASRTGPTFLEILRAAQLIPASKIGIKLGRGTSTGRLTFGGADSSAYSTAQGSFVTVANTDRESGQWRVALGAVKLGTTPVLTKPGTALLDTGSSAIRMSPGDAKRVHGLIAGAALRDEVYALPCNAQDVLSITVGTVAFAMQAADLVGPKMTGQLCMSAIMADARKADGDVTLGGVFLRNVYLILDSDSNKVSIAKLV